MVRSKRLGLVLSDQEKNLVVALARLEGELSLASLIRMLIYQAAYNKGLLASSIRSDEGDSNAKFDQSL